MIHVYSRFFVRYIIVGRGDYYINEQIHCNIYLFQPLYLSGLLCSFLVKCNYCNIIHATGERGCLISQIKSLVSMSSRDSVVLNQVWLFLIRIPRIVFSRIYNYLNNKRLWQLTYNRCKVSRSEFLYSRLDQHMFMQMPDLLLYFENLYHQ